jgi:putative ABC transport system permease protein
MSVFSLALKNIKGSGFRSFVIFLCVMGVAVFSLSTTLLIRGAERSLNQGLSRLGADIVVVPAGAEMKIETALLMGKPTKIWMAETMDETIAKIQGVEAVSPQIYLNSLYGASCCAVSEMFLVVFDPGTDFTIKPWLQRNLGRDLRPGEVIGGSYVSTPPGEQYIRLYGYNLTLKGNLEATGTGLDQTMFMTRETAEAMAKSSLTTAESPLEIPAGQISAVMVKVAPGSDAHKITQRILLDVMGVTPIESPNLFGVFRTQMTGLLWGFFTIMTVIWALSVVLIGLVFSMAANEKRREVAVLRALGATRSYVFRSVLTEAAVLAFGAGAVGITLGSFLVYMFRSAITNQLKMPFLFPDASSFLVLTFGGLALILAMVTLAALLPALRTSRAEPAVAMRE